MGETLFLGTDGLVEDRFDQILNVCGGVIFSGVCVVTADGSVILSVWGFVSELISLSLIFFRREEGKKFWRVNGCK